MEKKKPQKVEEAAAPYLAARPARKEAKGETSSTDASETRYIDSTRARKLANEILKTQSELFRMLAQ